MKKKSKKLALVKETIRDHALVKVAGGSHYGMCMTATGLACPGSDGCGTTPQ